MYKILDVTTNLKTLPVTSTTINPTVHELTIVITGTQYDLLEKLQKEFPYLISKSFGEKK
jgi:hypothetical protein